MSVTLRSSAGEEDEELGDGKEVAEGEKRV